jgi:hypothetical protein
MATHGNISQKTASGLPRWAKAHELCESIDIKDRRCLDNWGVKRVRFSRKCVRYDVVDFLKQIELRATKKPPLPRKKRRRGKYNGREITSPRKVAEARYRDTAMCFPEDVF